MVDAVGKLWLACALAVPAAGAAALEPNDAHRPGAQPTVIRDRAALAQHVAAASGSGPLAKLSGAARARLLANSRYSPSGRITALYFADIVEELSPADAYQVFGVFEFGFPCASVIAAHGASSTGQDRSILEAVCGMPPLARGVAAPAAGYSCNGGDCAREAAANAPPTGARDRSRDAGSARPRRADYDTLMAAGLWERAVAVSPFAGDPDRTLVAAPPDGQPPAGQAVYWQLDHAQRRAMARAVDLTRGRRVVVYATPGCGFCAQAIRAIGADPHLHALMREHSLWVSVPDINFRWSDFERWNAGAPGMPLHLLRERQHWPQRRFAAIPWFFLLEDGRVVGEHLGWLDDGPQRLRALLAPLGGGAGANAAGAPPRR